jgi:hypothetical protein
MYLLAPVLLMLRTKDIYKKHESRILCYYSIFYKKHESRTLCYYSIFYKKHESRTLCYYSIFYCKRNCRRPRISPIFNASLYQSSDDFLVSHKSSVFLHFKNILPSLTHYRTTYTWICTWVQVHS